MMEMPALLGMCAQLCLHQRQKPIATTAMAPRTPAMSRRCLPTTPTHVTTAMPAPQRIPARREIVWAVRLPIVMMTIFVRRTAVTRSPGVFIRTHLPNDDGIACTVDTCDAVEGCVHTADDSACATGNLCITDTCDPTADAWLPPPRIVAEMLWWRVERCVTTAISMMETGVVTPASVRMTTWIVTGTEFAIARRVLCRYLPGMQRHHTCEELQAIPDHATGSWCLVQDIDCSDTVNWNDGAGFFPGTDFGNDFGAGDELGAEFYGNGFSI